MKTKRIFLFCSFLWILYNPIKLEAQALKYTITYDSKVKHYARCLKGEEKLLNDIDKVNMRAFMVEDSYIIKVFANGDRETTVFHVNSNQSTEDVTIAFKTVIDKDGVRSFSREGKNLTNIPHSEISLKHYKSIKASNLSDDTRTTPEFKKVSDAELNEIKLTGSAIKNIPGKGFHMRNGNKELLYDTVNRVIENRLFEGKNLKYSYHQKFNLNKEGKIIPAFKKEINMGNTANGRNIWRFKEENISNYKVIIPLNGRSAIEEGLPIDNNSFGVYPNPASKEIKVQLPLSIFEKVAEITIYDMIGRIIHQKNATNALENINIEKLEKGMYLLQVETKAGDKLSQRFIKQ